MRSIKKEGGGGIMKRAKGKSEQIDWRAAAKEQQRITLDLTEELDRSKTAIAGYRENIALLSGKNEAQSRTIEALIASVDALIALGRSGGTLRECLIAAALTGILTEREGSWCVLAKEAVAAADAVLEVMKENA